MRDGAFALIWMALLPMAAMSAMVGILLWIWVAVLSPNEFLYGPLAGVQFNKIVAVATLGVLLLSKERKDFYMDATLWLVLALLGFATLSWLYGLMPIELTMDQYLKLVKELVLVGAITVFMRTRLRLHSIMIVLSLTVGFFSVTEAGMFLATAGGHKVLGVASIGDNNSLATAILMVVPMMMYLSRYSESRMVRAGFQAGIVFSLITVMATFSRGGFVGLVFLALFFIKNSRRKLLPILGVLAGCVLIVALAPESWYQRLDTINEAGQDGSFMGRVVVWKMSTLIALDRPLLGAGPHGVQYLPVWNAYRPFLPQLNFITTPPPDVVPHAAHSTWFEILGDFGFPGLILFVAILAVALLSCRRIAKVERQHPDLAWASDMARMMQITLVLYAVTTSALSMGYYEGYWIVIAVLSRLNRTVRQELAAKAKAAAEVPVAGVPAKGRPQPGRVPESVHALRGAAALPRGPARGQMRPTH